MEIELLLGDPLRKESRISLFYRLRDTPIARKYFACLQEIEGTRAAIHEPDRFYNFPSEYRDRAWMAAKINRAIDAVNAYAPGTIAHRATEIMTQEALNILHRYFEVYRGELTNPPEFYLRATAPVRAALTELNLLIHRYEDFVRNDKRLQMGLRPMARAVLTFAPRLRYELGEEDYQHFDRRLVFGTWNINYCENGKSIWDVYRDKDGFVGEANVRPLRYYSADAVLQFTPTMPPEIFDRWMAQFWRWWDVNSAALAARGFVKSDPRNAIGQIPVADLIRDRGAISGFSEPEIVECVGRHQYFIQARPS